MSKPEFCPQCGHRRDFHHGENGACVLQLMTKGVDMKTGQHLACCCTYYHDQEKGRQTQQENQT